MEEIWVAKLYISQPTAAKIFRKHGISPDEIRDAVECVTGLRFGWHFHTDRGPRAIIETRIRGRRTLVVLYERHDSMGDAWNLGSAYFVEG